jgi:hypothetical protein
MPIACLRHARPRQHSILASWVRSSSSSRRKSTVAPPTSSTVDRGTRFENGTLQYLTKTFSSMQLIRTGGANDGGVDLLGWWHINEQTTSGTAASPTTSLSPERVRVVVQCKNEQKKLGPIHVRELRGVATRVMDSGSSGLAILASSNGFSKQCLLQGLAWDFPLLFIHLLAPPALPTIEEVDLACVSLLPNDALSQTLLRGQMEIRHATSLDGKGQKQTIPAVYMNGKRLKHRK